jgi:hypothetical protein
VGGLAFGVSVVVLHSVSNAFINTCFWTCLSKNMNQKIAPVGTALAAAAGSLPVFLISLLVGSTLGEQGTAEKLRVCVTMLGFFSFMGVLFSSYLVYLDHKETKQNLLLDSNNESIEQKVNGVISEPEISRDVVREAIISE